VRQSNDTWTEDLGYLLFGMGPGRYGEYVTRDTSFPATTTIQFTAVEWLTEYGLIGASLLSLWLASIYRTARRLPTLGAIGFSALIVAVQFQANWKSPSFFTALAVLYSFGLQNRNLSQNNVTIFEPDPQEAIPAFEAPESTTT